MTRVVELGGIATELLATDRVREEAIDETCFMLPEVDAAATLQITFGSEARGIPEERFDLADGEIRAWWRDDALYLAHGALTARVCEGTAYIGGEGDLNRGYRQLFPYVITQLLAPHDRFVVHGGAIQRDGGAILVLGGTGSGKSTIVGEALLAGWKALADDVVVLRPGGDAPEVTGIAKPLAVDREIAHATRLPCRPIEGDARERWQVQAPVDRGWYPVVSTAVSTHGLAVTSATQRLDSGTLTEWLLYSFLARHDASLLAPYVPIVAALVRRGGWELRQATDGSGRFAAVARFLDDALGDGSPVN